MAPQALLPLEGRTIAVAGFGHMGEPIAQRLRAEGAQVAVVEPNNTRAAAASHLGFQVIRPVDVNAEAWVLSLPNADSVEALLFGNELATLEGALIVDMSTIGIDEAKRFHDRLAKLGGLYVDAPVSGGRARAAQGSLTMMVGTTENAHPLIEPIVSAIGGRVHYLGSPGSGAAVKIANNLLAIGNLVLLGAAMRIVESQDIDPETFLEVIELGSGGSRIASAKSEKIINHDFSPSFSLSLAAKDVGLAVGALGSNAGPVVEALSTIVSEIASSEESEEDIARLAEVSREAKGGVCPNVRSSG